jgi:serine/threonine-protein kinase
MANGDTKVLVDPSKSGHKVPADLLPIIHDSGVLLEFEFEKVRGRVAAGQYPSEPVALANRLVKDRILTSYQANRFLKGKSNGLSVGRYAVLDYIGAGSMGRVYMARHLLMDRVVALKVIAPEYVTNKRKTARFRREMRLVGRLDHPNVVRALDADQVDNVLFIVMEYVPGRCLARRVMEKGPLPLQDVVKFGLQAAFGLGHAHEKGIVHRDIKPSNLLVKDDGQLKILDFGLAILESNLMDPAKTNDGVAVGTVDYMSPEQALGNEVDGRSDLYSLGCVLYYLTTGKAIYPGSSVVERLAKRVDGRPVRVAERHPEMPKDAAAVLEKLLAPKVADRYQSADEAAEALRGLLRTATPTAHEAPSSARARPASVSGPPSTESGLVPAPLPAGTTSESGLAVVPSPPISLLPRWLRFLMFLAEQPPASVMAACGFLLLLAFGAGFSLAKALR